MRGQLATLLMYDWINIPLVSRGSSSIAGGERIAALRSTHSSSSSVSGPTFWLLLWLASGWITTILSLRNLRLVSIAAEYQVNLICFLLNRPLCPHVHHDPVHLLRWLASGKLGVGWSVEGVHTKHQGGMGKRCRSGNPRMGMR